MKRILQTLPAYLSAAWSAFCSGHAAARLGIAAALTQCLLMVCVQPVQAQEQAAPVEYASLPATREAAPDDASPRSHKSARASKRAPPVRATPAPVPTQPPSSAIIDEPVVLAPMPPPTLEPWRATVATFLTPFGINTLLAKMGMTGPAADILGCLLLVVLVSVVLFILLRLGLALRHQLADHARRKRLAEPKVEPVMDPSRLKKNTHGGAPGRSSMDSRNGPHSRPNSDLRSDGNSRLQANTRGGPDSRMGSNTRAGGETAGNTRNSADSRLQAHTRGGPDSRMMPPPRGVMENSRGALDSRLFQQTRGPVGMNSQFDTRFGMGNTEMRGHNPVVQQSHVPNAPPDFDQARFLRKARVYFLRLQLAWDKSDLASIRQFAAGPVFNEFRKQILERGDTTNCTDVLSIQTELVGIDISSGHYIANVKFTGMIKETQSPTEEPFEEVWSLTLPTGKPGDWVLAAIAQY